MVEKCGIYRQWPASRFYALKRYDCLFGQITRLLLLSHQYFCHYSFIMEVSAIMGTIISTAYNHKRGCIGSYFVLCLILCLSLHARLFEISSPRGHVKPLHWSASFTKCPYWHLPNQNWSFMDLLICSGLLVLITILWLVPLFGNLCSDFFVCWEPNSKSEIALSQYLRYPTPPHPQPNLTSFFP